ncbi:TlpA family protein disulfide reductase [Chitinophaga filiformis]|uniref:Thiol-disulfide isomerase or thioredoxin n=1 Tax=Chitinophaga filiformis TaxID=104663 RepID=A0A1G7MFC0_CHIFI|nr:thioredoxin family protein [Chitinophaga filiformis]SDF60512.1 Thiol-disulfide isomerase or thioredoxin [Chitinophaga filiformis]
MKRYLGILLMGVVLTNCGIKETIPDISLQMPDSTSYFNIARIPKGKPLLLIYYQPYCEACRAEWKDIAANMEKLKDVQFCLITDHPYNDMMAFYKNYNLEQYPNVMVGRDSGHVFMRRYKPNATPYNVFFDKGKRYRGGGTTVLNFHQLDSLINKL